MDFDSVAAVCFARTEYYMGSSDLTARFLAMLEGMGTKLKAVVLFGNPYAARHLPKAGQILLGFSGTQCEEAAIKVLAGELAPRGRVPVPLQLHTPQT
jgi:hypothetical protein